MHARLYVHLTFFPVKSFKIDTNLVKENHLFSFLKKMCGCACGHKNWCAGACAAHYQNVCNVLAGVAEIPRTLTVCLIGVVDAPPDKTAKILSVGCYQCRHNSLEEKRC